VSANDLIQPRTNAAVGFSLVHRHVGLAEWPGDHVPVQQVSGPDPEAPLRDDVEREPGRVLVELPNQRIDASGIEVGARQLVHGGDDPGVGGIWLVMSAQHIGELAEVASAHIPGPCLARHHEGQVLGLDTVGQQGHLRVAEN